jgi:pyridoxal phosphate enzyme (YggS family)
MGEYDYIENNLIRLKRKVEKVCASSPRVSDSKESWTNRDAKSIHIIAVSKTFPVEAVAAALDFNQLDFGENKVQEMADKHKQLEDRILNWHLIGRLQTNKVKYVVPFVFMIHSVDSFKLALEIQSKAAKLGKKIKCLVQVNTSGEDQKAGCDIQHTLKLVKEISQLENIKVRGLMTISKMMNDEKDEAERKVVRENFRTLKNLFDEIGSLNIPNAEMKYLSMGMTSDYDIAIEEGSNMLRVGTAIFGNRDK